MKNIKNLIFRMLSRVKNCIKTIALINTIATCASASTVSHGFTNGSLPNSIVPYRPLTPMTPTKVAHEIMKMDSVNMLEFYQPDLPAKSIAEKSKLQSNT